MAVYNPTVKVQHIDPLPRVDIRDVQFAVNCNTSFYMPMQIINQFTSQFFCKFSCQFTTFTHQFTCQRIVEGCGNANLLRIIDSEHGMYFY